LPQPWVVACSFARNRLITVRVLSIPLVSAALLLGCGDDSPETPSTPPPDLDVPAGIKTLLGGDTSDITGIGCSEDIRGGKPPAAKSCTVKLDGTRRKFSLQSGEWLEDTVSSVPCGEPPRGRVDAMGFIGMTLKGAVGAAKREGCEVRVVVEDGEELPINLDLRHDRINVAIEAGQVVAMDGIG
jgi:hypothetical protein